MFGRRHRRQRVRRTRRALLLRAVPALTVFVVLAGLLVAVTYATKSATEDVAGEPAEVQKNDFVVTPAEERPAYTTEDATLVAVADPEVPAIQSGVVVAELAPRDLPAFELLGVTWTGGVPADVAEVQVRWQQDGQWSEWTILDPQDEPIEGGIPGTEPKWVGPSQAAQARIVASRDIDPAGLTLVTVAPGTSPTLTQAASTAAATQPAITMRSSWGARPYGGAGCGTAPDNGNFSGTIVHHTAGSNDYTAAQSAGIVRSIQAYHMDGQQWCDIGYNFLVDRYGQVFEGRAGGITQTPYGAHAGNTQVNANTTGVSLMGEFTTAVPPAAMTQALVRLTAWRHSLFAVPAKGSYAIGGVTIQRIDGHRSVRSTACPGNVVFNWIGSPGGMRDQVEALLASSNGRFVKTATSDKVYLVLGMTKHYVVDGSEFGILASRFGWNIATVDQATLDLYANGAAASRYVRDQSTSALYLLQADGTKHRFPTLDLVDKYGYQVDSYLPLTAEQIGRFPTGAEVGSIFSVEGAEQLNLISGWQRRPITTNAAWVAVRNGSDYVARMSAGGAARYGAGAAVLESGVLVKQQTAPEVYLTTSDSDLVHVRSLDTAADLGVKRLVTVGDGVLGPNAKATGSLGPAITCGDSSYLIGSGGLVKVTSWGSSGLAPLAVTGQSCASLASSGTTAAAPFFVQRSGDASVYLVDGGQLHHVRSWARVLQLNGGTAPRILTWSAATTSLVPVGAPELLSGTYVQFGGAEIYRGDGRTLQHVTSYAALLRANGGKVPPIEQLPAAQQAYYTIGTPIS